MGFLNYWIGIYLIISVVTHCHTLSHCVIHVVVIEANIAKIQLLIPWIFSTHIFHIWNMEFVRLKYQRSVMTKLTLVYLSLGYTVEKRDKILTIDRQFAYYKRITNKLGLYVFVNLFLPLISILNFIC